MTEKDAAARRLSPTEAYVGVTYVLLALEQPWDLSAIPTLGPLDATRPLTPPEQSGLNAGAPGAALFGPRPTSSAQSTVGLLAEVSFLDE
jgi:hypothetical protein